MEGCTKIPDSISVVSASVVHDNTGKLCALCVYVILFCLLDVILRVVAFHATVSDDAVTWGTMPTGHWVEGNSTC